VWGGKGGGKLIVVGVQVEERRGDEGVVGVGGRSDPAVWTKTIKGAKAPPHHAGS